VKEYRIIAVLAGQTVFVLVLMIALIISTTWSAEENSETARSLQAPDSNNDSIQIIHGIEVLPFGKPGFRIQISRWAPHTDLSLIAIGPEKGEMLDIIPLEKPIKTDGNGEMMLDIVYERDGLYQGLWAFIIVGKPAAVVTKVEIPRMEPPEKERDTWKLFFKHSSELQESDNIKQ
jgi:hypothetical protein